MDVVHIGIIGDYDSGKLSHPETTQAVQHASGLLSVPVEVDWISSSRLANVDPEQQLRGHDGLFAAPGFFRDLDGGIRGIRYARESGKPFAGT